MRRYILLFLAVGVGVVSLAGCGGQKTVEPPVATPSLKLSKEKAAIGSPVKLTYRFDVLPDAKFDGDYWVFVHVLDPDGEQLWTDDHLPPTPTSQWKPGQTIEYTRTVFVPSYPFIGEAVVRLGLYSPAKQNRLTLNAQDVSRKEYVVAKFQVLPQSENVFTIHQDGWHQSEVAPENATAEWTWMKKAATISFRNPRKDVTFYLEYDARPDLAGTPQQVTIRAGDQVIATFPADSKEKVLKTFPISAAQLGSEDISKLVLEVDHTFVPGGGDTRELGIRVFQHFVEPK